MIYEGVEYLTEQDPVDIPDHTLGIYVTEEDGSDPAKMEWVCSCNEWAIRWVQMDKYDSSPPSDAVLRAHARHAERTYEQAYRPPTKRSTNELIKALSVDGSYDMSDLHDNDGYSHWRKRTI